MMTRYFSAITPQQAPAPSARQASKLGAHTALTIAQFRNCGTSHSSTAPISTVAIVVFQSASKLARAQATGPSVLTGAGRGAIGAKVFDFRVWLISALLDRRTVVIPIHQNGGG